MKSAQDSHELAGWKLDENAVEAAFQAYLVSSGSETQDALIRGWAVPAISAAIRAYLAASPPAPSSGTLDRDYLRGKIGEILVMELCPDEDEEAFVRSKAFNQAVEQLLAIAQPAEAERAVAVKRWPFVETPAQFADRLADAMKWAPSLLSALRHVLIENPAAIALPQERTDSEPYIESEPGEHQEVLDALAAHNSGEEQ